MWLTLALLLGGVGGLKEEAQLILGRDPRDARAGEILQQAVGQNPKDPEVHYLLGRWALVNGRFPLAISEETAAVQLSPNNPLARMQAWTLIAVASDQINENEKADLAFNKALRINRSLSNFDANAAYEYIKVLERAHRTQEVSLLVSEVLSRVPSYGPAHLSLAKNLIARQKYREAADEAEIALATTKDFPEVERDAHYQIARIYLKRGMPAEAETHTRWLQTHR